MIEGSLGFVEKKEREVQARINATKITVALLGASGKGLEERRSMAEVLSRKGFITIVPEDHAPKDVSSSLYERSMLADEELDLAFVNVESWGSVSEFSEFRNDRKIASKLRVMVEREYHPLYGSSKGYLSDAYLTHDAVFGHVYMCRRRRDDSTDDGLPTPWDLVMIISERYRQWKALS